MTEVPALLAPPKPLTVRFAERFGVEPAKMLDTLKATAFKQAKDGLPITNEQMMALLIVAEQYGLNPFTREIFAFPDKGGIVPVVSVDGWARIINEHRMFDGVQFSIENGPDGLQCTCVMYRKDRAHAISITEYLQECKRGTAPWQSHPRRMLRHKALIQCARLAFGFAGIYDEDEAHRIIHGGHVERVEPPSAGANRVRALLGTGLAEGQTGKQADGNHLPDVSEGPSEPSAPVAGGPRSGPIQSVAPAGTKPAAPPAFDDDGVFELPAKSLAAYMDEVTHAADAESAGLVLDEARGRLMQPEHSQLVAAYRSKWSPQPE